MMIEITAATVVLGSGSDTVLLKTTLPESVFPYKGTAVLKLDVAYDGGADYVREHLKLEPRVVNGR